MNKVIEIGRFTKDPESRTTQNGTTVARFTLAVDRKYKAEGSETADFISCIAFGKTAEFICKYFQKGNKIGTVGRIQTGSYTKEDGTKVYTTDVVVEECEFVENKADQGNQPSTTTDDDFLSIPDNIEEELPFA